MQAPRVQVKLDNWNTLCPHPYELPLIWMASQIQTLSKGGIWGLRSWDRKVRTERSQRDLGASGSVVKRQPLLPQGQSSQFNTLHEKVGWLGCSFRQDLKPVPKLLQAWSWRLDTDTYNNHFTSKRCAGIRLLQKTLRKPSSPDTALIAEHEARVKPVSERKKSRRKGYCQVIEGAMKWSEGHCICAMKRGAY